MGPLAQATISDAERPFEAMKADFHRAASLSGESEPCCFGRPCYSPTWHCSPVTRNRDDYWKVVQAGVCASPQAPNHSTPDSRVRCMRRRGRIGYGVFSQVTRAAGA